MLLSYSGSAHTVVSGVSIIHAGGACEFTVETTVNFDEMGEDDVANCLAQPGIMGMAGAYGIQGVASRYIRGIAGDYYNVVGLPINEIHRRLRALQRGEGANER
jgi:septum formation protein